VAAVTLKAGESVSYPVGKDRRAYLVPATGAVEIDNIRINARDGVAVSELETLDIKALEDSEVLLVDAA
jgi:redox-sensitive bicupin YhaK (pirin superfamily)